MRYVYGSMPWMEVPEVIADYFRSNSKWHACAWQCGTSLNKVIVNIILPRVLLHISGVYGPKDSHPVSTLLRYTPGEKKVWRRYWLATVVNCNQWKTKKHSKGFGKAYGSLSLSFFLKQKLRLFLDKASENIFPLRVSNWI